MKRTISLLLLSIVFVAGCTSIGSYKKMPIWDIYSDFSFVEEQKFLSDIEKNRPAEFRLLELVKHERFVAYDNYVMAMQSALPDDEGKPVIYQPTCYLLPGVDRLVDTKPLEEWYKKETSVPMPKEPPHTVVASFIDQLSNGLVAQACQDIDQKTPFYNEIGGYKDLGGYLKKILDGKRYARVTVKKVAIENGARFAVVDLDILSFQEPRGQNLGWEFKRTALKYKMYLREDGTWIIKESVH
ncbi:hypothetical protein LLF85_03220 [bacterium]|nr:hypothetical protein [bacterium]